MMENNEYSTLSLMIMEMAFVYVVLIIHHKSLHGINILYNTTIILSWYQILVLTALHPQTSSSKMTDDQEYLIIFLMIMAMGFVPMVSKLNNYVLFSASPSTTLQNFLYLDMTSSYISRTLQSLYILHPKWLSTCIYYQHLNIE